MFLHDSSTKPTRKASTVCHDVNWISSWVNQKQVILSGQDYSCILPTQFPIKIHDVVHFAYHIIFINLPARQRPKEQDEEMSNMESVYTE